MLEHQMKFNWKSEWSSDSRSNLKRWCNIDLVEVNWFSSIICEDLAISQSRVALAGSGESCIFRPADCIYYIFISTHEPAT